MNYVMKQIIIMKAKMNKKKAISELWNRIQENPELGKSVIEEAKRRCEQMEAFNILDKIDPRWETEVN